MRQRGRIQRHGPSWRYMIDLEPRADGKRRRTTRSGFRTRAGAQRALNDALRDLDRGEMIERSDVTLGPYLDRWLDARLLAGLRPTTIDSYRRNLTRHVVPVLGHRRLQALRAAHFNALYLGMLEGVDGRAPVSARTTRYAHTVVRRALEDARREGLIRSNPTADATPPSATAAKAPEMTAWTPTELRTFLTAVAESDHWPLLWLAAFTGMRRGELCGLRWSDVDLDASALTIRSTLTTVDHEPVVGDVKTRRSRRRVDLDSETVALLRRHKIRQAEHQLLMGAGWQNELELVFTMPDGRPWHPDVISRAFARLVTEVDVPRIRLHDLRHTHASHLLAAGANVKVVSERLGHSSVSFTLDTYAHVMPGQRAHAAAAVAAMVARS